MKRYIVGIHNGVDVDDYYVSANSKDETVREVLSFQPDGTVYTVVEI